MPGAAEHRRELVHQADGDAGRFDFRRLREARRVETLEGESAEVGERERERHRERRARRQSGPDRHR